MTAIAARRKRGTVVGAAVALVLAITATVMFVVGVNTLSNSQAGESVGIDERPREQFPETPNALLAVQDDGGDLVSLAVLTLLPAGQGGSIVPVRVDADATSGFSAEARPLDAEFDPDDVEALVGTVEEMLSISLQRAALVDPAVFESLIEPIGAVSGALSTDEADGGEPTDPDAAHAADVAVWESLASAAPIVTPPDVLPTDDLGRPIPPSTVTELFERLFEGPVGVRDLALAPVPTAGRLDPDAVVLDRRDSTLVFAQVSPALVSTPNPGLKIRVVAPYTSAQIDESDGLFESTNELLLEFIDRMLFVQNNVVSVDSEPAGAAPVTVIEVFDPRLLEQVEDSAEVLFGEAEVRLADEVLEGVDIEVTLGMSYLDAEAARVESVGDESALSSVPESATATVVEDG